MEKLRKVLKLHLNVWDATFAWTIWKILDWLYAGGAYELFIQLTNSFTLA